MAHIYVNKQQERAPYTLPTLWVTTLTHQEALAQWENPEEYDDDECQPSLAGWYYVSCLPGCMPDGDFMGPYATEKDAAKAGREDFDDDECDESDLYTDEDY